MHINIDGNIVTSNARESERLFYPKELAHVTVGLQVQVLQGSPADWRHGVALML